MANFGPQDLEHDIIDSPPGERVEAFLCGLLFLLLNRKQDVKYVDAPANISRQGSLIGITGLVNTQRHSTMHFLPINPSGRGRGRAPIRYRATTLSTASHLLREYVHNKNLTRGVNACALLVSCWANYWYQLSLLRALAVWSLSASETVKSIINKSYKGNRQEDDLNQPLSIQPWGSDSDKRRYYLIEGLDDTAFRVYRESNPAGFNRTWRSVAGSIEEITALAEKLETKDGGPKARKLAAKMMQAIPRFEATEEVCYKRLGCGSGIWVSSND